MHTAPTAKNIFNKFKGVPLQDAPDDLEYSRIYPRPDEDVYCVNHPQVLKRNLQTIKYSIKSTFDDKTETLITKRTCPRCFCVV